MHSSFITSELFKVKCSISRIKIAAAVVAMVLIIESPSNAQIADQVVVFTLPQGTAALQMSSRFDRKLNWLGDTSYPNSVSVFYNASDWVFMTTDRFGKTWIPWDTLSLPMTLVLNTFGQIVNTVMLTHYPLKAIAGPVDKIYLLTRIPVSAPGPLYCMNLDGSIAWSSMAPLNLFQGALPQSIAISTSGFIYLGGSKSNAARVSVTDPNNVNNSSLIALPPQIAGSHAYSTVVTALAASPDGGIWILGQSPGSAGGATKSYLVYVSGSTVIRTFLSPSGNGTTWTPRIDAKGTIFAVGSPLNGVPGISFENIIVQDKNTGQILKNYLFPGTVTGFAFGPSGEELFVTYAISLFDRYLARLNLVTNQVSAVPLDPILWGSFMAGGDPTGFIYANVVDRSGDNDNDGFANGVETAAGSSPFDATSVPTGPKVYLTFTPQDTISVRYVDPDGILDPAGGIVNLNFVAGRYGDVTSFLFQYITNVIFSPDGKELTVDFGGYTVQHDLKVRLEANVWDATGAHGHDWQFTPPGIGSAW